MNPILESYDVAVIGGGINGVAVARDAALRGLSVVLLEKEDFASGASSTNSKLVHGGLRYLAHFELRQVRESMRERDLLLKNAPELVWARPFALPVYEGIARPYWMVKLGLIVYDWLDRVKPLPGHSNLSRDQLLAHFPGLRSDGLQGGCLYYDAQMKDARVVIETMLDAGSLGAHCWNYVRVSGVQNQEIAYVSGRRGWSGVLKAKAIVNATGAWANQLFTMNHDDSATIRPSKGVHLVIPQVHAKGVFLVLSAPQDGRLFFVIPWESYSLIGTTDTFYEGDPDRVKVDSEDIDYLRRAYEAYFDKPCSVISSFVGLRPLPSTLRKNPSNVSRRDFIHGLPQACSPS